MPCGEYTATDVDDAGLAFSIGLFQIDHPLKIETKKQDNGKWTVVATSPPCANLVAGGDKTKTLKAIREPLSLDKLFGV